MCTDNNLYNWLRCSTRNLKCIVSTQSSNPPSPNFVPILNTAAVSALSPWSILKPSSSNLWFNLRLIPKTPKILVPTQSLYKTLSLLKPVSFAIWDNLRFEPKLQLTLKAVMTRVVQAGTWNLEWGWKRWKKTFLDQKMSFLIVFSLFLNFLFYLAQP